VPKAKNAPASANLDRRAPKERRHSAPERRTTSVPVATERRQSDRRKVPRRRQIDPTTCERDYSVEELEFMNALDDYKRRNGRMFPTCSEILEVVRGLGYEKRLPRGEPVAATEMTILEAANINPPASAAASA
jgi:hypothetical protein